MDPIRVHPIPLRLPGSAERRSSSVSIVRTLSFTQTARLRSNDVVLEGQSTRRRKQTVLAQAQGQPGTGDREELQTAAQENWNDRHIHTVDQSCVRELSKEVATAPQPE